MDVYIRHRSDVGPRVGTWGNPTTLGPGVGRVETHSEEGTGTRNMGWVYKTIKRHGCRGVCVTVKSGS